ncbi:MAG: Fe-S cluster assembly ATPase SufC [Candidatus Hodarchaeales archaeon]|jgi:Fe-S cluster assembly ATP-binding protein
MSEYCLEIKDLYVKLFDSDEEILKGVSLVINKGEFHALMGLNGSGKTTLAKVIMGHPHYEVTSGDILFNGESIIEMKPDERARKGLFLAFQYPQEIPGVSLSNFMRTAINARLEEDNKIKNKEDQRVDPIEFNIKLRQQMKMLNMDTSFSTRHVNTGFSGGEKKRSEILQMSLLEPDVAVLDEIDSGLDIDALKTVANGIASIKTNSEISVLMITHYQRILNYIDTIDHVHVMMDGKVVLSGGRDLAEKLEAQGYDWVKNQFETSLVS